MRRAIAVFIAFLAGVAEWMTYNPPHDAISNFSKWLSPFGIQSAWLEDKNTDRDVRCLGVVLIVACGIYLGASAAASIRRAWKNREPRYPSPFARRGKQILRTMSGTHASVEGGIVELREGDEIVSTGFFNTPVVFRIRAKTSSTNIRFSYVENELIFNWEYKFGVLRIDGGPLHGVEEPNVGQIPQNEWVTIDLFYYLDSIRIDVDGDTRYRKNADFSKVNTSFSIFTGGHSTVYVKSVIVGTPKETANSYRWLKSRRFQLLLAVCIGFACGIFVYKLTLTHHGSSANLRTLAR